ncbi:MAG: hypothetical protein A2520_11065 [Deltaproteobacteria bacterium RIFOXYD12_FULL_53_23]|nr:MAG: hypothetical protein A2520_11065 [Deltaproteobacteria bacterium RIFOXYD12_FULL_53_23]
MQAVEFKSKPHDNVVDLPANLREWNDRQVRVILLADEEPTHPASSSTFKAISLKTSNFRFDRDAANAR